MKVGRGSRRAATAWLALAVVAVGCGVGPSGRPDSAPAGDVAAGQEALQAYGCGACHSIPGVSGADGMVGPPLDQFGQRAYVAGRLPNNFDNLVRWIRDPQDVDPETAMPDVGATEEDAINMAAYLLSLD